MRPRSNELVKACSITSETAATMTYWARYGTVSEQGYRVLVIERETPDDQYTLVSSTFVPCPSDKAPIKPTATPTNKPWVADVLARPAPKVPTQLPIEQRRATVHDLLVTVWNDTSCPVPSGKFYYRLEAFDRTGGLSFEHDSNEFFDNADQALAEGAIEAHLRQIEAE